MSARQDFTLDSSRDYGLTVVITEADGTTAFDLSGCTLQWVASRAPGQTPLIIKSSDDAAEIDITSAPDGEATIFILPEDTVDFGGMTCSHELLLTDSVLAEATVLRGLVTITQTLIAA